MELRCVHQHFCMFASFAPYRAGTGTRWPQSRLNLGGLNLEPGDIAGAGRAGLGSALRSFGCDAFGLLLVCQPTTPTSQVSARVHQLASETCRQNPMGSSTSRNTTIPAIISK